MLFCIASQEDANPFFNDQSLNNEINRIEIQQKNVLMFLINIRDIICISSHG